MISKWVLSNFKSIREKTELELAPLTIFAGANSSGKSTFIQSILMIAQTLSSKVGSRSVVLNGPLTRLGQFDDLKSNDGESDEIDIEFVYNPLLVHDIDGAGSKVSAESIIPYFYGMRTNQIKEINCKISFKAVSSGPQKDLLQIQPLLLQSCLSCKILDGDSENKQAFINIKYSPERIKTKNKHSYSDYVEQTETGLSYEVTLDENSMAEIKLDFSSAEPNGCILKHFLPRRIIFEIDTIQEDANSIAAVLQGDYRGGVYLRYLRIGREDDLYISKEVISAIKGILKDSEKNIIENKLNNSLGLLLEFFERNEPTLKELIEKVQSFTAKERHEIRQILPEQEVLADIIKGAIKKQAEKRTNPYKNILGGVRAIADASWSLDQFFSESLKYLGPLRDAPKPIYQILSVPNPNDVGTRGEYIASILELHKNTIVNYIPSEDFNGTGLNVKKSPVKLEIAVVDWLKYLGLASSVKSVDKGKLGYELKVGLSGSNKNMHDLTHVGVGVSQVLPILVMCFLSRPGSTLVFEQPELHLHPKVQTLLGDFFLSVSLCQKQCIVETHSEYLIDRIRYRIASSSVDDKLKQLTKLYFVEKPEQTSLFREVVINEYGAIVDWPEGFFDHSQKEAENLLLAAAKKRKAKMVKKND